MGIKILKHFRPRSGPVLFLTQNVCVKSGPYPNLAEASTLQFISRSTAIPVPKIYCAFCRKGQTYIVMQRIQGDVLGNVWSSLTDLSKAHILAQLRDMIDEMRRIQPVERAGVSNIDGGPLFDCRLPGTTPYFGPFETTQEYHRYLRGNVDVVLEDYPDVAELIRMHNQEWPLCLTHADLSSLNILVQGDKVVGIVDWETSGWYPSYWEYTTAWRVNPQNNFWQAEVDKFLDPFPQELEMEKTRQKYFGEI